MHNKKTMLIIMDGWGLGKVKASDAIQHANIPFVSSLYALYPHCTLTTYGEAVGLPDGQMGNSEVGHLNLGAGRVVYQDLVKINLAIKNKTFDSNPVLLNAINYAINNNKTLHLMGLVSNGGVHSHINHLMAITSLCAKLHFSNVRVHAFTDGRDTDPKSGYQFINDLQTHLDNTTGKIASVIGRYYAMDRDKRWERVKIAYDCLVHGKGTATNDFLAAIAISYEQDITDEFIAPLINTNISHTTIEEGDAVLCFNYRTDRCREITEVLTQHNMPSCDMNTIPLHYTTITNYDHSYINVQVMYDKDNLHNTLGEVIATAGKTQLRIAETEKYPHVSYFFSGGRELPFINEQRIMVASPKVATYDMQPQMSAYEVADKTIQTITQYEPDFICLNFANADMVGHTGVWQAIVKAVEAVDNCVEKVVTKALDNDYTIFLLADHGNADYAINEDGTPNTAHTLNPVPLIVIDKKWRGTLKNGKLADIAPTILTVMNLPIPEVMTGDILIE